MSAELDALRALALPLFFLFFPFLILKLKGYPFSKSLSYLFVVKSDFSGLKGFLRTSVNSFLLLIVMLAITAIESIILFKLGLMDLEKVQTIIMRQSAYVLFIAVIISPIAEEVFFRGLLQRRFGMLASTFAFGLSHALYGSVAELIGALTMGLLLSFYVQRKRSLAAPIFAHMAYNLISVLSMTLA